MGIAARSYLTRMPAALFSVLRVQQRIIFLVLQWFDGLIPFLFKTLSRKLAENPYDIQLCINPKEKRQSTLRAAT